VSAAQAIASTTAIARARRLGPAQWPDAGGDSGPLAEDPEGMGIDAHEDVQAKWRRDALSRGVARPVGPRREDELAQHACFRAGLLDSKEVAETVERARPS
jgi:hypothetical protein